MTLCNSLWNTDSKYAKKEGIMKYWLKADMLPMSIAISLKNEMLQEYGKAMRE